MRALEDGAGGQAACSPDCTAPPDQDAHWGRPATACGSSDATACSSGQKASCRGSPRSRRAWRSVGEPPPGGRCGGNAKFSSSTGQPQQRQCRGRRRKGSLLAALLLPAMLLLGLAPLAAGQPMAVVAPAPPPPPPDPSRLAYETSDSDTLLPRLSSYFPPGTLLGDEAGFAIGVTRYRVVGTDTRRNAPSATGIGDDFLTAVKESFNQEYQTFNLLVRFDNETVAQSAPVVNVTTAASSAAAAAANAAYRDLVTDRFNVHQQYEAVDIDVTAIAGSDLAARLPGSWLPLAKNTPLFENAMRQRGYLVTCLTLDANVSAFAAQNVLNLLPSSNSTAVQMQLQLVGENLLPMTTEKQTLVLFSIQQLLPRLFNGIGSRWARITKVSQSLPSKSANVTVLMATSSVPEYFEQALVTALQDLPAMLSIAGMVANASVMQLTPVPGNTLATQVASILGKPAPSVTPDTMLFQPQTRPLYNVSTLDWQNGTLPAGQQVTIGTVSQRVVGQFTTDVAGNNVTAEVTNAFRIMNLAKPWNYSLSLSKFTASAAAPQISASESETGVIGNRRRLSRRRLRKLLQVSIESIDTQDRFNTYNDFASLDFKVQFNATRDTALPSALLPLSLPLNLAQAVLRARGIIANVLTLDAQLSSDSTELLQQITPTNSSAVTAGFTLVTPSNAQGAPIVPFTVPMQTAIELLFRSVLPPLSNGLGPRWTRIQGYSAGATASDGVNVTLLMYNSQTPLSELDLVDGALLELSGLLAVAGLPVTLTQLYAFPVAGYTLEAQLRSELGLPEIKYPVPSPSQAADAALPPGTGSGSIDGSTGGGGLSGAAIGGIVAGVAVAVVLGAVVAACLVARSRQRKREAAAEEAALARSSSGTSMDSKTFRRRPDDSAEQLYNNSSTAGTMVFPGASRNGSPHGTFTLPRSLTKQSIGQLDASMQGWDIDAENIEICRDSKGEPWLLGEGSYGKVYRGLRGGVQDVAVKVLHASDEAQTRAFRKEISILKSISYDRNIVQFYGAVLTERPMLVLEYMEGGDLRAALNDDPQGELRWYRRGQSIALDIARGLHFLHSHDVMHSDMKARNVLLSKGRETAKISDVGVARYLNECATATQSNYVAWTFAYAAPEILLNQKIGAQADVYSFGVMLWEIVTGIAPVRGGLSDVSVPEDCPAEIADLMKACLSVDPDLRPTAKRCFQIIRASIAGEDASELQPTFSPSHLSYGGSSVSLSNMTDSIAEPIVGGTYSAPNSAPHSVRANSGPGSVRASSECGTGATFGAYGGGGTNGSVGGSVVGEPWEDRLPSARRTSAVSDTSAGSGPSRLRHGSSATFDAGVPEELQQLHQQQHPRPPSPLQQQ